MRSMWKQVLVVSLVLLLAGVSSPVLAQQLVNMEFQQAPLVDVFQILGQIGGYNVLVDPSVSGNVSFTLNDLTVEEALDLVTRTTGYRYQIVGNTMVVASQQRLKSEFGTQDFTFVIVEHVPVASAQRLVSMVIPGINSYIDPEVGLLVLFGFTSDLDVAKQVIQQYDRPSFAVMEPGAPVVAPGEPKPVLELQAVPVFYANGPELAGIVQQSLPDREIKWDEGTRNIRGTTTAEEWAIVEAFVKERDIPTFTVKGILGSADQLMVLIEYKGTNTLLKPGDVLQDWTVTSIENGVVEFSQADRSFTVRMGR
ncbi:MAG: secretin and TonB N-terminal domain-containing protein [Limnochordia bacterium]|jgi:hypothetical protein|nr:hypothetical protein [Bacillota bacterium]